LARLADREILPIPTPACSVRLRCSDQSASRCDTMLELPAISPGTCRNRLGTDERQPRWAPIALLCAAPIQRVRNLFVAPNTGPLPLGPQRWWDSSRRRFGEAGGPLPASRF